MLRARGCAPEPEHDALPLRIAKLEAMGQVDAAGIAGLGECDLEGTEGLTLDA